MRATSELRNDLAHDLNSEVTEKDLQPIKDIVWAWHRAGGKPCHEGIDLIKNFSLLVAGLLASEAKAITRYGNGDGLIAYRRWLSEAMKIPDEK